MDRNIQLRIVSRLNKRRVVLLWLLMGALARSSWMSAQAADGPMLIKTSLHIRVEQSSGYWAPNATKEQLATSCWVPKAEFEIRGPLAAGSQVSIDFTKPDGSPWLHWDLPTTEVAAGRVASFETPHGTDLLSIPKKFIVAVGTFGFKINYKNELEGQHEVLFSGKFKVNKVSESRGIPNQKNMYAYYVNYDWALPMGYVWYEIKGGDEFEKKHPPLRVALWFRGDTDSAGLEGHLFYQGKEIQSTKDPGGDVIPRVVLMTVTLVKTDPKWSLIDFKWDDVVKTSDDETNAKVFYMDKNPGEYEVKVLRDGKLSRDVKFTVGDGGEIVDNGLVANNNIGTKRVLVPVKVIGTGDGPWQQEAWKTDTFYGNPLKGFTAP